MVRRAEYSEEQILDAATALIAGGGPSAASMTSIAKWSGAPTGSLYHRFPSRTVLLALCWIRALKGLTITICPSLSNGDGKRAVLDLLQWADDNRDMARLLILNEESDIIDGAIPDEILTTLNGLHKQLGSALGALLKKHECPVNADNIAILNYAVFDAPLAALRPALRGNGKMWPISRQLALNVCDASMTMLERK